MASRQGWLVRRNGGPIHADLSAAMREVTEDQSELVADWVTHRVTWVRTVPGLSGQIREAAEKQYGDGVLVGMRTHPELARMTGCEHVRVWVPVSRVKFREFI